MARGYQMFDWTEERIKMITELWLDGWTSTAIAQKLHVSRRAVRQAKQAGPFLAHGARAAQIFALLAHGVHGGRSCRTAAFRIRRGRP